MLSWRLVHQEHVLTNLHNGPAGVEDRLLPVSGKALAGDGLGVRVQEPCVQKLPDQELQPACGVEMVHVGQPVRVDLCHQGHGFAEVGEVLQV